MVYRHPWSWCMIKLIRYMHLSLYIHIMHQIHVQIQVTIPTPKIQQELKKLKTTRLGCNSWGYNHTIKPLMRSHIWPLHSGGTIIFLAAVLASGRWCGSPSWSRGSCILAEMMWMYVYTQTGVMIVHRCVKYEFSYTYYHVYVYIWYNIKSNSPNFSSWKIDTYADNLLKYRQQAITRVWL